MYQSWDFHKANIKASLVIIPGHFRPPRCRFPKPNSSQCATAGVTMSCFVTTVHPQISHDGVHLTAGLTGLKVSDVSVWCFSTVSPTVIQLLPQSHDDPIITLQSFHCLVLHRILASIHISEQLCQRVMNSSLNNFLLFFPLRWEGLRELFSGEYLNPW